MSSPPNLTQVQISEILGDPAATAKRGNGAAARLSVREARELPALAQIFAAQPRQDAAQERLDSTLAELPITRTTTCRRTTMTIKEFVLRNADFSKSAKEEGGRLFALAKLEGVHTTPATVEFHFYMLRKQQNGGRKSQRLTRGRRPQRGHTAPAKVGRAQAREENDGLNALQPLFANIEQMFLRLQEENTGLHDRLKRIESAFNSNDGRKCD